MFPFITTVSRLMLKGEIVRDERETVYRESAICRLSTVDPPPFSPPMDHKTVLIFKVFVQMKLCHWLQKILCDCSRISTFANTQNKIQIADFSANDPFHRRIEELSRTIWAPAQA